MVSLFLFLSFLLFFLVSSFEATFPGLFSLETLPLVFSDREGKTSSLAKKSSSSLPLSNIEQGLRLKVGLHEESSILSWMLSTWCFFFKRRPLLTLSACSSDAT
jgi:hypothetical protein